MHNRDLLVLACQVPLYSARVFDVDVVLEPFWGAPNRAGDPNTARVRGRFLPRLRLCGGDPNVLGLAHVPETPAWVTRRDLCDLFIGSMDRQHGLYVVTQRCLVS